MKFNRIQFRSAFPTFSLLLVIGFAANVNADIVQWSGNGHYYEAISTTAEISWEDAQADAVSKGGYLVTLTSAAENSFVFGLIDDPEFWFANSW